MSVVSMADLAFARQAQVPSPPPGPPAPAPLVATSDNTIAAALKLITSYIPTEIITIYVAGLAVLFGKDSPSPGYVLAHVIATPLVMWVLYASKFKSARQPLPVRPAEWPWWEMSAAVVAFAAWTAALQPSPVQQWIKVEAGGFLVLIVTTALGLLATLFGSSQRPPAGSGASGANAGAANSGASNSGATNPNPVVTSPQGPPPPRGFGFGDVQAILDEAVDGHDIGAHGPFWRGVTRDEFVGRRVFGCPIIHSEGGRFVGALSPLVRILQGPIECPPGRERPPMPLGFPQVAPEKVQLISDWIDGQCPP